MRKRPLSVGEARPAKKVKEAAAAAAEPQKKVALKSVPLGTPELPALILSNDLEEGKSTSVAFLLIRSQKAKAALQEAEYQLRNGGSMGSKSFCSVIKRSLMEGLVIKLRLTTENKHTFLACGQNATIDMLTPGREVLVMARPVAWDGIVGGSDMFGLTLYGNRLKVLGMTTSSIPASEVLVEGRRVVLEPEWESE